MPLPANDVTHPRKRREKLQHQQFSCLVPHNGFAMCYIENIAILKTINFIEAEAYY